MGREINEILIEISKTNEKYFKNYLKYSKIIAKIAKKTFKNSKVLLFGSILKSKNPQDIDILIVSDDIVNKNLRYEFFIEFNKKIEFINPFEIHFATESQFENFYKYFLDKFILIE